VGLVTRSVQPEIISVSTLNRQDRRPLSPPPILRLWVRDSNGQSVDPRYVVRVGPPLIGQPCQHQLFSPHGRFMVGRCGAAS
jgi:hypothetical protein